MDSQGLETEGPGLSAEDEAIINEALQGLTLAPSSDQSQEMDSDAVNEVIRQVLADQHFETVAGATGTDLSQDAIHTPIKRGHPTELKTPEMSASVKAEVQSPPAPATIADPVTPPEKITQTMSGLDSLDRTPESDLSEFYKEFEKLHVSSGGSNTDGKTLILLSPLSYKHVFSRWWINKRYISTIVERPQRLMACDLGIGAAITRFDDRFVVQSSNKRTRLDVDHVSKVHGQKWGSRLYQMCASSKELLAAGKVEITDKDWNSNDIYLTEGTIDALEGVVGAVETAVNSLLGTHSDNSEHKASYDQAFVTIRPPGHHSHPCAPSGFCLINNVHIGIQYAKAEYGLTHAVILDFDLHHGDGSQDICWKLMGFEDEDDEDDGSEDGSEAEGQEEDAVGTKRRASYAPPPLPEHELTPETPSPKDSPDSSASPTKHKSSPTSKPKTKPATKPTTEPTTETPIGIGYFSIHDIHSFPTELGYATAENIKNASVCLMAHGMCIWNVHLEPYDTEEEFYDVYDTKYNELFRKARQYLSQAKKQAAKEGKPFKSMIVISAGFDASEYEGVGMQRHGVHVPTSFYNKFTIDAQSLAREFSDNKLLSLLEGGYSDQALSTGIFSHLSGLATKSWNSSWVDSDIAKELEKGCKLKWKSCGATFSQRRSLLTNGAETISWLDKSIKLGRSLWPQDIREQAQAASMTGGTTTGRKAHGLDIMGPEVLATPSRVLRDRTKIQTPFKRPT